MKEQIIVSICCITYNQADYLKEALDGFLKQKTNFKYEVIIHDDASTDGTTDIIKEYEKKYPDIIKPIYEEENQYSKGCKRILNFTFEKAVGKYIAICEGDDYWTDENKLQKQVEYMEAHPDCTFCFHNATILNMKDNSTRDFVPYAKNLKKYIKKDSKYNVSELELLEFIPTASFMFRKENLDKMPKWFNKCFVGDWPLKMIMTNFGYAYFMNEKMCVYRQSAKGSMTDANNKKENESLEKKIKILTNKQEMVKMMNDYTCGKYSDILEYRINQYETEKLIAQGKKKEILNSDCFKNLKFKLKIKYFIKIYFKPIVKIYKKIKM